MLKKIAALMLAAGLALTSTVTTLPVNAAGAYFSELTGEPTDGAIQNQRPIAVMVDNDSRALPHYGLADADIVYELVNSTANYRITRLMGFYKTWGAMGPTGNIRSTRPTNIMLASEYNAILIHDGGPFYNNPYFASTAIPHLSAVFTRIRNGKASEFTEFVANGAEIARRAAAAGYPTTYTAFPGKHFNFAPYGTNVALNASYPGVAIPVNSVSLPYGNTKSRLVFNAATQTYDYYEYGKQEFDADKQAMTFKNVLIQNVDIHQYDRNGYLIYNCIGFGTGFYLTNGYLIPVTWLKPSETGRTFYVDPTGKEVIVNTGKTFVTLVPSDTWAQVGLSQ